MSVFLLDVNVLIALMWPAHEAHASAQRWFAQHAREGWATCAFTQAGFVRILSNPAFSPDAVTPREAVDLLSANVKHRHHQYWGDTTSFIDAIAPFRNRLVGHRQVTDAYLLGLAIHHRGRLATLDRGILALIPEAAPARSRIELLSA